MILFLKLFLLLHHQPLHQEGKLFISLFFLHNNIRINVFFIRKIHQLLIELWLSATNAKVAHLIYNTVIQLYNVGFR